jgi:hypothetical protein
MIRGDRPILASLFELATKGALTAASLRVQGLPRTKGRLMTLTAGFALAVPPSPAEWRDMENTHLAWLRIAHVIAAAPSDDCVKELAASMPDGATFAKGLAAAASFFHEFAELATAAEIRFLDACVEVGR